jgi:hypothetical protein
LPRVGEAEQSPAPVAADGKLARIRSNPRLVVAIAAGAVLVCAWIGWAIHVTSSNGASAGLGVVIAWPAILAALALISLPFIGGYLLIRRLSPSEEGSTATAAVDPPDADQEDEKDSDEEPEDPGDEGGEDEESDDASESNPEAESSAKS